MTATISEIRTLVMTGDLVHAKAIGEDLCAHHGEDPELLLLLGIINGRMADLNAAEEYARRSIGANDASADAHFFLATVLREKGDIDSAIEHAERGLEINPHSSEGHNKLGAFFNIQNNSDKAEKEFRLSISSDADNVLAHYNLGRLLAQKVDLVGAEDCFKRVLQIRPEFSETLNELGSVLYKQGKLEQAVNAHNKAIAINPQYAEAYTNKGMALDMLGMPKKAVECLREAVRISPEYMHGRLVLASTLLQRQRLGEAIVEYEQILGIDPDHIESLIGLAHAYLFQGLDDKSIEYSQKALSLDPDSEEARAGAASVYDRLSRFEEAYHCLLPIIEKGITTVSVAQLFVSICRHVSQCDKAVEQIEAMMANQNLLPSDQRMLCFSLAKLYDRQKNYDLAFKYYNQANKLKFWPFDPEKHARKIDSLITIYNKKFLESAPHAGNSSEKMIFIVGMPRSGTSLVEQILDSHSQVFGAGELTFINQILMNLPGEFNEHREYPYYMTDITARTLNKMSQDYMDQLPAENADYLRVTDKLPENFLQLGLIELMFPDARIIHCYRDPLDTCLSCYFQDFSGFLNYAFNLEHLGFYYLQYLRLMGHWKSVLSLPVMDVQYESVVQDPEQNIRSILEFCNLPWEENCMNFHESTRVVKTASYDQVRRPIYKGSVGRWKNYNDNLLPLKKALSKD